MISSMQRNTMSCKQGISKQRCCYGVHVDAAVLKAGEQWLVGSLTGLKQYQAKPSPKH